MADALAIGIPAIIVGARTITSQLFGVKSYDPMVLLLTTAALSFATFVATVVPAQKAASLEPSMRYEPNSLSARVSRND